MVAILRVVNPFYILSVCFPDIQVRTGRSEFLENSKEASTSGGHVWTKICKSRPGRAGQSVSSKAKFWCQSGPISIKDNSIPHPIIFS
jgi:hypothetical protein